MHCLRHLRITAYNIFQRQSCEFILNRSRRKVLDKTILRTLSVTACVHEESVAKPLRSIKSKSKQDTVQYFVDLKQVKTNFFVRYYHFL